MFNINLIQAISQFFRIMQQQDIQIPQNIQNYPDAIIQYLMNNGKITQQQYNAAVQQLQQHPNNPMIQGGGGYGQQR